MKWEKPPIDLVDFVKKRLESVDCEVRNMFGAPTGFINGNMFMGAHQRHLILRLSQEDMRDVLTKYDGVKPFEPMSGRVMREYVAIPAEIYNNGELFDDLVNKSVRYVSSLPPKGKKK